jgi:phosphopantetheinyl transferase
LQIEWLDTLSPPGGLPAAWLLDLAKPELRRSALAIAPAMDDLARAASRPTREREDVLVRRGLTRLCVGAALGVPATRITVGWTAKGAPLLAPPHERFRLSFAQRGTRFACALALEPVGIDIEIADGGEIPWKVLHPSEIAVLGAAPARAREKLFLRIWAAKEAYAKALGEGFAREPSSFATRLAPDGAREAGARDAHGFIDDPAERGRPIEISFSPTKEDDAVVALVLMPD